MTATDFRRAPWCAPAAATGWCSPVATDGTLLARPLGGSDDETTVLLPEFDDPAAGGVRPAHRR